MRKERLMLLLATAAVAYLFYHVVFVGGGFLSGLAVGLLVVYLVVEWSNPRDSSGS
jgi:hypothetical protein